MPDQKPTSESKSITTYCIEHAKSEKSKCTYCEKLIPNKSLRVGEIFRKDKKVKKSQAKHTWSHFKCWKVPSYLTHVPIDHFRGYPLLNEKDKARVRKVIAAGIGASMNDLIEKAKPVKTEEELEADKEADKKKELKKKEDLESADMDMTEMLTGTQVKKSDNNKKATEEKEVKVVEKTSAKPAVKKGDEKLKAKTDKSNKVTKKKVTAAPAVAAKVKEVVLPEEDQLELMSIAKEFAALK